MVLKNSTNRVIDLPLFHNYSVKHIRPGESIQVQESVEGKPLVEKINYYRQVGPLHGLSITMDRELQKIEALGSDQKGKVSKPGRATNMSQGTPAPVEPESETAS